MAHKTPQGTWRVRWIGVDGQRRSKCFKTRVQALKFEVKACETYIAPEPSKQSFEEFANVWLEKYAAVHMAPGSVKENRSVIFAHLVPAFGDVPLAGLTRFHLLSLQAELVKRVKPKTANNVIALAKTMALSAVDWELIPSSPFRTVEMLKVGDQKFGAWRPEERDYFARHARQHDPEFTSAVVVACHTGLRRGELAALRRYHLDFDKRLIEVSEAYCFKTRGTGATKNRTRQFIPMNEACYRELKDRQLQPPDTPVFRTIMLLHPSLRLKRLCEKIGARVIPYHGLRHTFASCLVTAGVPLYTVQKLMRHKTPLMTQRYAHLSPGYLSEAIEAIAPKNDGPDLSLNPNLALARL